MVLEGKSGRTYRIPNESDQRALKQAEALIGKDTELAGLVPDEELPYLRSIFNVHVYGFNKWARLFSPRQLAYLTTLAKLISKLDSNSSGLDAAGKVALKTVMAFLLDKAAMISCNVARWRGERGGLKGLLNAGVADGLGLGQNKSTERIDLAV